LFARVGASDNVVKHISTFHMEMSEMAHIISHATPHSLVILDEIGRYNILSHTYTHTHVRTHTLCFQTGRGTSAMEGLSIAWAVMEHLHNVIGMMLLIHCSTLLLWLTDCRTLLATHYHELESLARSLPGVACYKLVAERSEDDLIFTYRIEVLICVCVC